MLLRKEEEFIKIRGVDIFYKKYFYDGKPKRPFVMLHGNGESSDVFEAAAEKLAKFFTVYTPDTRGHGKSSDVNYLDYREVTEDFYEFLKQLKINNPVLLGASDGGIAGLMLASEHPDCIGTLIACGANLDTKALKSSFLVPVKIKNTFKRDQKLEMMIKQPPISTEDLAKIKAETFILAGEDDITKPGHQEFIAENIKGAKLKILKGENHFSYIEDNEKLFDILRFMIKMK